MNKLYILFALILFASTTYGVSRFDPILKEIIKYQEFEIEAKEYRHQLLNKKKVTNLDTKETIYNLKEKNELKENDDDIFIEKLYFFAKESIKNDDSAINFFEFLLENRLEKFIYYSYKATETLLTTNVALPPQDIELFNQCNHHDIEYSTLTRITNIERYQLIVSLIKKLFQILSIDELTKKSINLLCASPALWDILQNKTTNLGHEDQSGGYIKVKVYMEYFKCDMAQALLKIMHRTRCPKWEKNKKNYDVYLYESHFIPKKKFIESKLLGANGRGMFFTLTDYENGECDDLPYPDFLKTQPEHPFLESESFFDTFDFNLLSDEVDIPAKIKLSPTEHICNNTNNIQPIDTLPEKSENIIDHSEPIIDNEIILDNKKIDIIDDEDYLPPSGIRKFHNLMPEAPYPPINLKKKDQRFIDTIFNSKTSHTISYGEFKKFWNKMSCQIIENTGSSHKQLIGPNGDALYGVSAHNDAHTYGKNTIKYFRAALYYIGCRPS
ncbi:MAG: hypothetical protein Q8S31_05275 [Alphaproteobacteria bacterium]|nr:hypothetical protein [Alphaproteobacteria bacterium]